MAPLKRSTYAVTFSTFLQHSHFQRDEYAELFVATFMRYREQEKFQVHGFAVMPKHVHMVLSPAQDVAIGKCVQLMKGGYSFAVRSLTPKEIWQAGYHEHRVRDLNDFDNQLRYVANNPTAGRLSEAYRFVHTHCDFAGKLDPCPIWFL